MTFAAPHFLWLVLAPVALLVWEITHRRRTAENARPKILRAEAGAHSLEFAPASAGSAGGAMLFLVMEYLDGETLAEPVTMGLVKLDGADTVLMHRLLGGGRPAHRCELHVDGTERLAKVIEIGVAERLDRKSVV